ncbi:helix-hairpin-helix domain-containing protein [Candidatus Aminicenantes bacterium AH-873-B07]|jgi:putative DNA modification/repair radical SAM protein|nr:helix-hairpin-helix domain-containing protein [Candidatus Aminicenantes bacterium AH-873-B07]
MLIKKSIDLLEKVKILGDAAKYDICLSSCIGKGRMRDPRNPYYKWIYPASLPNGSVIPIFKVLLKNYCEKNCFYCINPVLKNRILTNFTPNELSRFFINLVKKRIVHGLFLSSGMGNDPNRTMEDMLKTVEIIRKKYRYYGYVHLKILPGVKYCYVEKAVELANRVSINLEAPTKEKLNKIAPEKDFENDLIQKIKWVHSLIKKNPRGKSQTTQFVIGASDETDYEILNTTYWLYREYNLWRVYFSAFQPIIGTPLEEHPPTNLLREHRLYQADFLIRYYGFSLKQFIFDKNGNLPLWLDPKMNWALNSPDKFPIEINNANYEELIQVPGIGPKTAKKIIIERKKFKFHSIEDLKNIGVIVKRALPFILINGKSYSISKQFKFNFINEESAFNFLIA